MKIVPVFGYEGYYEVSDTGRVFSSERYIKIKHKNNGKYLYPVKSKELKQQIDKRGYLRVCLSQNKKERTAQVHRLIAQAFIPNPENKPQVNHKDCNKQNNNDWNLEWVTNSENMLHAHKNNRLPSTKGEKNVNAKLTEKDVLTIRNKYDPNKHNGNELAKEYNVCHQLISDIILRKKWKHI